MALRNGARGWLDAVSSQAFTELREEVGRLAGELAEMRAEATKTEARQRSEFEALRGDVTALAERFEHASQTYAAADDLAALASRIEGEGAVAEALRLKLAGVAEQIRWESEDLRKALTAIAERVERKA
jgi:predicted  nucleic acid-binding Zn-ribbon protein